MDISRLMRFFALRLLLSLVFLSLAVSMSASEPALVGPAAKPSTRFSFRDNFNYKSLDEFTGAGWVLCGNAQSSYYILGRGRLTLLNDGTNAATVCWNNVPAGIGDWSITARSEWVGNTVGSILLAVRTSSHYYIWIADGYYNRFVLQRYDTPYYVARDYTMVVDAPGYSPELNLWHTISLSAHGGVLAAGFDGNMIGSFQEPDPTTLTAIVPSSAWMTDNAFAYVTAASL